MINITRGGCSTRSSMDTDEGHLATGARGPARHQVLSLKAGHVGPDPAHSHVSGLETEAFGGGVRTWGLLEFVEAVRLGERFYLRVRSGSVEVEPTVCADCSRVTIATVAR